MLTNCRILYTRSQQHFPAFAAKIMALGGQVWHLPLLDTAPIPLSAEQRQILHAADDWIFTSVNAVEHLLSQQVMTEKKRAVAIGEKTARALLKWPFSAVLTAPPPFNSEALLSLWQPQGRKIAILAAAGGRKVLFERLQGANKVAEIFCYHRFNPSTHYPTAFPVPDVITIASQSTLNNLIAIIPQSRLKLLQYQTCVAALSPAVARYAAQIGFQQCISAKIAAESDQIEHICRWWNTI